MSGPLLSAVLAGALFGGGILALYLALRPARPSLAVLLAKLDTPRDTASQSISAAIRREGLPDWRRRLGGQLDTLLTSRGVTLSQVRSDLAVLGRSMEGFLATTVVLSSLGLVLGPILVTATLALGVGLTPALPLALGLICALGFGLLPYLALRQEAGVRRRDFRHAVGSFLDLVAMNLAGGRGVPESLTAAAQIGGGWPFARIRDTLSFARLQGLTPWAALGRLGEELKIDELRDLSAALTLVADDGAKIRQSLTARAATLRRRELAEIEGKAAERSQSMLVAQLVVCLGFLLFLAYPAVYSIFSAG
jgi:tight adherence protein C